MRIAIIGTGHMGSWFVRELAEGHQVAVYDSDPAKMEGLEGVEPLRELAQLEAFEPQMLLNAVSLKHTAEAFESVLPYLPEGCLLADIATIKGDIPGLYQAHRFPFVSVHPMFGPRFADLHQISGENAVIVSESDERGKAFFREFFEAFDLKIFEYSFAMHDELMGVSLTLPFSASIAFSACAAEHAVPGTTYARHKDIARKLFQEDDYLLAEVLFSPNSIKQLDRITAGLEFLKHVIKAKDYEEAERFFNKLRGQLSG